MSKSLYIVIFLCACNMQQASNISDLNSSEQVVVAKKTTDQILYDFKGNIRSYFDRMAMVVPRLFQILIERSFIEPQLVQEGLTQDEIMQLQDDFIIEINTQEDSILKILKEHIFFHEKNIEKFITKNLSNLEDINDLLSFVYKLMETHINDLIPSIKHDFNKVKDVIYSKSLQNNYMHRFQEYEKILREQEKIIIQKLYDIANSFQDALENFKMKRVIQLSTQHSNVSPIEDAIVGSAGSGAASITTQEISTISSGQYYSDRLMNLVIYNDVAEVNNLLYEDDVIKSLEKFLFVPTKNLIKIEMLQALLGNQLVMCTQLLWNDITELTYIVSYIKNFYNPASKKTIQLKNIITQGIIAYENFKQGTIRTFQELIAQIAQIINDSNLNNSNLFKLFEIYIAYDIILAKNYVCKKLSHDFMLFVPMHIKDPKTKIPEEFYQKLPDINYKNPIAFLSTSLIEQRYQRTMELKNNSIVGKSLLEALLFWNTQIKQIDMDYQPFTNVILMGHGGVNATAELVIKNETTGLAEGSDFLNFLNFLNNNLRIKTLLIFSCLTGGKKNIEAYNLTDKFNNFYLEKLKFTIINIGVLYGFVHGSPNFFYEDFEKNSSFWQRVNEKYQKNEKKESDKYDTTKYERCFLAINKRTPDYQEMIETGLFSTKDDYIQYNYISFKLPHTSWFTPAEFNKNVMKLSQIDVSTKRSTITIPKNIKIILLGANYIPEKLKFDNPKVIILPTNYHNQNYYFKSPIQMEPFLNKMDYLRNLNEPLNIIFRKFIVSADIEWTNYCIFIKQRASDIGISDSTDEIVSGYAYVDKESEFVFIFDNTTQKLVSKMLNRHQYHTYIESVRQSIIDGLPKAYEEEFLASLSSKIAKKPQVEMNIGSVAGGGASAGDQSLSSQPSSSAVEKKKHDAAKIIQKAWKKKQLKKAVSV